MRIAAVRCHEECRDGSGGCRSVTPLGLPHETGTALVVAGSRGCCRKPLDDGQQGFGPRGSQSAGWCWPPGAYDRRNFILVRRASDAKRTSWPSVRSHRAVSQAPIKATPSSGSTPTFGCRRTVGRIFPDDAWAHPAGIGARGPRPSTSASPAAGTSTSHRGGT